MQITVIGTGFVGVVSAAVYASFGHRVIGLDIDEKKVASLKKSQVPFYEPELEKMLEEQQKEGSLSFTTSYSEAIPDSDIIIIAVGTPSAPEGGADLGYVLASIESLAPEIKENTIVAVKSTVPPGSFDKIAKVLDEKTKKQYYLASLPEFLREGSAVRDTLQPDRVVIGSEDQFAIDLLTQLHKPLQAPVVAISPESAQMAKYTANAYLATRITFINEIADLCSENGADIEEVVEAVGYDKRIGEHYWYPGFGYGGSCFPKDVKELAYYSKSVGLDGNLLTRIDEINEARIPQLLHRYSEDIDGWEDKTVAILGLSFKPNTDDMREAPSTKVIPQLLNKGARVKGFDPRAMESAQSVIESHENLTFSDSIEEAVKDADIVIALIEWPEIVSHDFSGTAKKGAWFIDARNQFDPKKVKDWGYQYLGVGRRLD